MNKKIMIGFLMVGFIFLVGCVEQKATDEVFFNMVTDENCKTSNKLSECDHICSNSGVRINGYQNDNRVTFDDGRFVCKCY